MRTNHKRKVSQLVGTSVLGLLVLLSSTSSTWAQGRPQGRPDEGRPAPGRTAQGAQPAKAVTASASMTAFRAAYDLTKTAKTEEELTAIIEKCQQGLQERPNEAETQYANSLLAWTFNKRGEARAEAGHDDTAMADFEEAIKLDATRWNAYHNRGVSYGVMGNLDAALLDFNRVIQLNPNYPKAFYNRGEVRFRKGDLAGAIDDYGRCLRLTPNDSAAYTGRGFAYYSRGDYRNAIRDYGQAIRANPANAEAYTHRGDAYADQGQFPQALADFEAALRADAKFGRAYQSAAWLRATCPVAQYRNPQQALAAAQKAIELDGETEYRYLAALAAAQANLGQFEDARQTIDKAIARATEVETPKTFLDRLEQQKKLYEADKPYRDVQPGAPQPRS